MSDDTAAGQTNPPAGQAGALRIPLTIPDDVRAQFPDLVDLVVGSESMNDEERQYWINILPIMTPEQIKNLRDILASERQQLTAIDAQYASAVDRLGEEEFVKTVGEERQQRAQNRTQAEVSAETAEKKTEEDLLQDIEGL